MNDPTLLDIIIHNKQGIVGAALLSVAFSAIYGIVSEYGIGRVVFLIFSGCVFSGAGWLFLCEYVHLAVYFVVPVALLGSIAPYPLLRAYIRRQDSLANKALDIAARKTGVK